MNINIFFTENIPWKPIYTFITQETPIPLHHSISISNIFHPIDKIPNEIIPNNFTHPPYYKSLFFFLHQSLSIPILSVFLPNPILIPNPKTFIVHEFVRGQLPPPSLNDFDFVCEEDGHGVPSRSVSTSRDLVLEIVRVHSCSSIIQYRVDPH